MDELSNEHMAILARDERESKVTWAWTTDIIKENAFAPRWSERECSALVWPASND